MVACCLISAHSKQQESQEISDFLSGVKEAFSEAFDPKPEPVAVQFLPPARSRRYNQVEAIANPVIITPPPQIQSESDRPTLPKTLRSLRQYIREHNLQALVKEQLGKSVSNCSKNELLAALNWGRCIGRTL